MTNILGIDEAGKGAVIGPLVIGAAVIEKEREGELKAIGVKDSKLLTPAKREEIYEKLKHILKDFMVIKLSARDIDEMRKTSNLNRIEADKFAVIINTLNPDVAILDAPQVSTEKFAGYVRESLKNDVELISENKADLNHLTVAAASILAKVERDREIEKIKKECGVNFGVGYPSDERTISFLEDLLKKGDFPDFVRHSWDTASRLKKNKSQRSIGDF